jgi:manganese-dependent inorganic pyrophosphatase
MLSNCIFGTKKEIRAKYKAGESGELNKETEFVMDYFKSEIPALNPDISGRDVILVDHNERTQTADGFEGAKILELIDHHRIANFNVDEPLKVRMEPVGCTSTIIFDMYKENGLLPDKITAGLMLSAIISDTLLFKSPTCTEKDTIAGRELSKIAEIDLAVYGVEMLKAGTALDDKTINELLNMDMKIFDVNDFKIGIAQINAVDEKAILAKKEEILLEISNIMKSDNLNMFMFVVTNILTNNSMGLVAGEKQEIIEKVFGSKIINSELALEGIVSRKKQIVPPLTKALSN